MKSINPQTRLLDVRGLKYCIHEWGDATKPQLFLIHGWMDCGASFKFIAPYLIENFHIIAPDLRGFGDSEHAAGGYWFPDYLADVDALFQHYSPHKKVNIVGHSMGANIALMYSGIQNDRVKKVMGLDSLGLLDTKSSDTPIKFRQWMTEVAHESSSKVYSSLDMLKSSIRAVNPTLPDRVVEELPNLWAIEAGDGSFVLKHDHRHRDVNPMRYNFSDVLEIWKEVKATVSLVMASDSWYLKRMLKESDRVGLARSTLNIDDENYIVIQNSNHMMHLEQPAVTAECIKRFFRDVRHGTA